MLPVDRLIVTVTVAVDVIQDMIGTGAEVGTVGLNVPEAVTCCSLSEQLTLNLMSCLYLSWSWSWYSCLSSEVVAAAAIVLVVLLMGLFERVEQALVVLLTSYPQWDYVSFEMYRRNYYSA